LPPLSHPTAKDAVPAQGKYTRDERACMLLPLTHPDLGSRLGAAARRIDYRII